MIILGLNAFHGDSSACILADGKLIAAAEEERFRRIKHWSGLPTEAVRYCLTTGGITLADVDHIAVNRDPRANFFKKVLYAISRRPSLSLVRDRLANTGKISDIKNLLCGEFRVEKATIKAALHNVEHHRAHLGSSFFVSPFEEAAVVSVDGFGDFVSTMWGRGNGSRIRSGTKCTFPIRSACSTLP